MIHMNLRSVPCTDVSLVLMIAAAFMLVLPSSQFVVYRAAGTAQREKWHCVSFTTIADIVASCAFEVENTPFAIMEFHNSNYGVP